MKRILMVLTSILLSLSILIPNYSFADSKDNNTTSNFSYYNDYPTVIDLGKLCNYHIYYEDYVGEVKFYAYEAKAQDNKHEEEFLEVVEKYDEASKNLGYSISNKDNNNHLYYVYYDDLIVSIGTQKIEVAEGETLNYIIVLVGTIEQYTDINQTI